MSANGPDKNALRTEAPDQRAHRLTRIQGGSVHLYLAYLFAALLVVLASLRGLGA